jgi:ABC-type glutathione transport system ATPase component
MVFQDHALWPNLSVLDTVAYPLRRGGAAKTAAHEAAHAILAQMNLGPLAERRPGQLSGGEQQRVGLARALACEPALYLFDEPTAHLDASLRMQILEEVARRRAADGAAAIYATHDAAEALAIADRVAVLHSGRLAQAGPPADVYAEPDDLTVARLTGPVSVLDASVHSATAGRYTIDVGEASATVPAGSAPAADPAAPAILVRLRLGPPCRPGRASRKRRSARRRPRNTIPRPAHRLSRRHIGRNAAHSRARPAARRARPGPLVPAAGQADAARPLFLISSYAITEICGDSHFDQ